MQPGACTAPADAAASLGWLTVFGLLTVVLVVLVGFAFAGSEARLAAGVHVAGVDVGGLTNREARARARGPRRAGGAGPDRLHRRRASSSRSRRARSASRRTGRRRCGRPRARARASARCAASSGCRRASSARRSRRRCRPTPPRSTTSSARSPTRSTATTSRRSSSAAGSRSPSFAGQAGLRLDRDAAADTVVRALARFERGSPGAVARDRRPGRGDRGRARARRTAGAGRRLRARPADLGRDPLEASALAARDAAPAARERRQTRLEIGGPDAARWFRRLKKSVDRAPVDAKFLDRVGHRLDRPRTRTGSRSTRRRPRPRCWPRRRARRTASAKLVAADSRARADDGRRRGDGDRAAARDVHDPERRHVRPHHEPPARGRAAARRARGSRRGLLVQRPHRRAHDRARLPAGAGDHQGRVRGGRRRRRLPGRDDGVQRGVGVGREDRSSATRTRSTSAATSSGATRPSTSRTSTSGSGTTRPTGSSSPASWDGGGITVSLYGGGPERRVESSAGTFRITGSVPRPAHPRPDAARRARRSSTRRGRSRAPRASTGRSTTPTGRCSTTRPGTRPTGASTARSGSARSRSRSRAEAGEEGREGEAAAAPRRRHPGTTTAPAETEPPPATTQP